MTVNGKTTTTWGNEKYFKKHIREKCLLLEITGGYHNDRSSYNKIVYEDILNTKSYLRLSWALFEIIFWFNSKAFQYFDLFF
jgi:hypothetical protein